MTGKKPCARDGHAGLAYDNNMIIIGGDRHMISFSDVYLFKMDKHQADVKCEQVINMLMACDENQKDVVCRTMQTLIEAMRGEKNP